MGINSVYRVRDKLAMGMASRFLDVVDDTFFEGGGARSHIGTVTRADYARDAVGIIDCVHEWREFESVFGGDGVRVEWESKTMPGGVSVTYPHRLVVAGFDDAVRVVGGLRGRSIDDIRVARDRLGTLVARYGSDTGRLRQVIRRVANLSSGDFEALLVACDWFSSPDADGLTARQVPLALVHAKWVERNVGIVEAVVGHDVSLVPRSREVRIKYCAPVPEGETRRRFDSQVVGDVESLAYEPSVVVVVENKDCFDHMPEHDGLICVWGAGNAHVGADIASLGWVRRCPRVLYWGDLDVDGFVLLDRLRASGVDAASVCMDEATCREYARLGTNVDSRGRALSARAWEEIVDGCGLLTDGEREAVRLIASGALGVRRIEQERIDFDHVMSAIVAGGNL